MLWKVITRVAHFRQKSLSNPYSLINISNKLWKKNKFIYYKVDLFVQLCPNNILNVGNKTNIGPEKWFHGIFTFVCFAWVVYFCAGIWMTAARLVEIWINEVSFHIIVWTMPTFGINIDKIVLNSDNWIHLMFHIIVLGFSSKNIPVDFFLSHPTPINIEWLIFLYGVNTWRKLNWGGMK